MLLLQDLYVARLQINAHSGLLPHNRTYDALLRPRRHFDLDFEIGVILLLLQPAAERINVYLHESLVLLALRYGLAQQLQRLRLLIEFPQAIMQILAQLNRVVAPRTAKGTGPLAAPPALAIRVEFLRVVLKLLSVARHLLLGELGLEGGGGLRELAAVHQVADLGLFHGSRPRGVRVINMAAVQVLARGRISRLIQPMRRAPGRVPWVRRRRVLLSVLRERGLPLE